MLLTLRNITTVFCLLFAALTQGSPVTLQKLGMFPATNLTLEEAFERFYNSKVSIQLPDSFRDNAKQHWFLYQVPPVKFDSEKMIEIPDYQLNEARVYLVVNGKLQSKPLLVAGDELDVSEWTFVNRTPHQLIKLQSDTVYQLLVEYSRPGNRPQFLINLHELDAYFVHWAEIERRFGFLYGLIFIYLMLILALWLYSRHAMYFYLFAWVCVYMGYFFISSGHLKYLLELQIPGLFSTIRVTLAFLGLYAINAFSILHYQREEELQWVSVFWNMLLVMCFIFTGYNFITGENLYNGLEKQFILIVRYLVFVLIAVQIYLPYKHYKEYREFTYLTYVMVFSGLNFFVYLYQTVILEELDFNNYIFTTIWFLILEIIVIALGISLYALKEQQKRVEVDNEMESIQKRSHALQFEVQEFERKRIASELHDDILNRLSVLLWMFRDKMQTETMQLTDSFKKLSQDIRSYAAGLYPDEVDLKSLEQLIKDNIVNIAQSKGIQIDFKLKIIHPLSTIQKLHLFRTVQEFVRNSINHANASKILIAIEERQDSLRIHLNDDGQGYNTEEPSSGLGLISIKNRVQILGGQIDVKSAPGNGVQWNLYIPQN